MNLPFIYIIKPIENYYIKIHHAYFNDFNILFKTVRYWKMNILFAIKDYNFAL